MSSPKQFQMTPDAGELDRMNRDLRFRPANPDTATSLSKEQVEHYNAEGYILPLDIYSPDEITAIRAKFDAVLEATIAAGGDSYSIATAHLKHAFVYDMLTNPVIVDRVADLLGPNLIGWGSHFLCKMPGDGRTIAWHQDASYWPLSPSNAVTVWLAIDDSTVENACMKFIAGSHHSGHLTWRPSNPDEHNILNQTVENAEDFGDVILDELRAGQASMHNDMLLHASDANESDRRRCGLTLRYCAAYVQAEMDWSDKGVVVRGEDSDGHWGNAPRPDSD